MMCWNKVSASDMMAVDTVIATAAIVLLGSGAELEVTAEKKITNR